QKIAHAIDHDLVQYLDMADNGATRNAPGGYGLSAVISGFNHTWIDEQAVGGPALSEGLRMKRFRRAMEFIRDILANAVAYRVGAMLALDQVRRSEVLEDGRVLL